MCTARPDQAMRHTCQLRIDKARFQRCAHALFNGEVLPSLPFLLRSRGLYRDEIALKRMATEIEIPGLCQMGTGRNSGFPALAEPVYCDP